uniref:L-2-amino-thiazoline-4-carboxylic acid hydrolase n=1 Tax=Gemmiger qucibialis TaxID=2997294 RepID=UPI0022E54B46
AMKATAALKAADRNPYSWNMELYEYPDGSGYEGRFTKCGICVLMKELGLYDLTPVFHIGSSHFLINGSFGIPSCSAIYASISAKPFGSRI